MRNTVLKDLFIIPDIDNSRALVTFTVPDGLSHAKWFVESGASLYARGD